jgi:hypothetical protein
MGFQGVEHGLLLITETVIIERKEEKRKKPW